ncbi:MAG: Asd/ArgC dimerization domain-containing protein [Thermoanaerobaculia bacterium]
MRRLALIHPTGLVAAELREALEKHRELWDELRLLSSVEDEAGVLTSVRGTAAVIQSFAADHLDGVDLAFFDGPMEVNRPLLEELPPDAVAVLLSPDAGPEDGHPVVAGVNPETAAESPRLISPHPGTVALAHLLYPLLPYQPYRAVATLLEPASTLGKVGLDEMLAQTRSVLAFQSQPPRDVLPAQMAFNVLPDSAPTAAMRAQLSTILGTDVGLSIRALRVGVFHSYGVSLYVDLDEDPGVEAVIGALGAHPVNELAEEPGLLGPIDAAARDEVLIGSVVPEPGRPGGYHLWAAMDNLTCGGAGNALAILEALTE